MADIQLGRCATCNTFSAGYRFADDFFLCDGCVEEAITEHFARLEMDLPTPEYFADQERRVAEMRGQRETN